MTIDPRDYWLNNDGPPYLGPTGLHAWADAILATARAQTATDVGATDSATREALDAVIAAAVAGVSGGATAVPGGPIADAIAARNTAPVVIVVAGDSTAASTHVSEPTLRWPNRMAARMQAAFRLTTGTHPGVVTLATAVASPPATPGIHVVNAGVGGALATTYITTTTGPQIAALAPDLLIHMIGANDFYYDVSTSTYKSAIADNIDTIDAASVTTVHHMLVHVHEIFSAGVTDGTAHPWSAYGQAMAELAAARGNVSYLDLDIVFKMAGLVGTTDATELVDADRVHASPSGHALTAAAICDALAVPDYPSVPDTGWVAVTPGTGWGATAGFPPQVRRVGNRVDLIGAFTRSGTTGALASIGSLPEGFWPGVATFLSATVTNGGVVVNPYVTTGGVISHASGYIAGALASGAILPVAGTWYVD